MYAAEHETSVNAIVRELLEDALLPENRAVAATKRLLTLADQGPLFTIDPRSITREELHERR
jgi:plasmid stability protein